MNTDTIPHSRLTLGQEEIAAVSRVLATGQIAQGDEVAVFEREFSDMVGVKYAAAVSSGTTALHLSLLALGVGAGDEVIIPSYVCTALLNAVHHSGATPVIADIDPNTLNIDSIDVEKRITKRTKALIVPHMFGLVADMGRFASLGLPVIEDCAQAVGARRNGKLTGTFGQISIFSFYATKMMACGEGGLVVSDSQELIERIRENREYDNRNTYSVRYNYKMTDFQAAMGRQQLRKLPAFIARRREIATFYNQAFGKLNVKCPLIEKGHIYYRYIIKVEQGVEQWLGQMLANGVSCARPIFKPLHHYIGPNDCPNTDSIYEHALSIPIFPSLSEKEIKIVISALKQTYNRLKPN